MNVRQTLKAMAVALPLALTPASKATAQAANIVKNAEKIVVTDTLKAMENKAVDSRTLLLKKYNGHFNGNVVNGKIGNGKLDYAEKGRLVPASEYADKANKTSLNFDATFIKADNLPAPGFKIHGGLQKGKDGADVTFGYASKNGYSDMIANASYTRNFPLGSGFTAYGKAGANTIIRREAVKGGDHHGIFTPNLNAGMKYDHKFPSKVTVGATAEVGGGPAFYLKTDAGKTQVKRNVMYNAEARVGYKDVEVFGQAGRDDILGNQFGVGTRVKF